MTRSRITFWIAVGFVAICVVSGRRSPVVSEALAVDAVAEAGFGRDVVGFLEKHCISCHGDTKPKGELSLTSLRDEKNLYIQRKLVRNVLSQIESGEMPPKAKPRPTIEEAESMRKRVTSMWTAHDKNAKPDPGRVTARRLNRTEYNNTVRDLVGIDFTPADDFPSDDIGYGFDNIGDVLTISPVLMERYLSAAEAIMSRAILPSIPKTPERWVGARYLEPGQPDDFKSRPLGKRGLNTPYSLTIAGEYKFRLNAWGHPENGEYPTVIFRVDGKEFHTVEIRTEANKSKDYEVGLTLPKGPSRIEVVMKNPTETKDNPRMAFAVNFMLWGPTDMRPLSQRNLLERDTTKPIVEQTRQVLNRFASKAFRRPATPAELDRLMKVVARAEAAGDKWESAVSLAMQAVLVSPKFLFRVELSDKPGETAAHALTEYQLASRLSYFLWSTMPDKELFDLAAEGRLSANLDEQVVRMLKDPRATSLVENFAVQWLQIERLRSFAPDAKMFPNFNEDTRRAMRQETVLFLSEIVREDLSILTMIDSDFTYINNQLGWLYGIKDTAGNSWSNGKSKPGGKEIKGEEFVRVSLQDGERGGLLTQASILTVTSNPTRTSPVKRGKWVLEQLLGTPPPPPPPDVPELKADDKAATPVSLRKKMELHRANVACANCHAKMDPLGFAFENYNAIGGFRREDGKIPIDASGALPDGKAFKGAAELKKLLLEKKDPFARCLAEKMMTYALGRGLDYYDNPTLDATVVKLQNGGWKFSVLVSEIVKSDAFRLRRGSEKSP